MSPCIGRRTVLGLAVLGLDPLCSALAQDDAASRAPFGLTWGSSAQEVQALGVTLTENAALRDYGRSYEAKNLDRVLSDTSNVLLSFGWRDKLIRVFALGRPVPNDPYGGQVIARYEELIGTLTERYGRPRIVDQRDTEMWKAPNEYIASIKQGRAARFAAFSTATVQVELSVRAQDYDTARYAIIFEYRPGMQDFGTDKKAREREAL